MRLPGTVQEIADVIGRERALYLIGQLPRWANPKDGHIRVILYVPQKLRADDGLVKILGWDDAAKLHRVFKGELVHVGNCFAVYRAFRDKSISALAASGMPSKAIAEIMDVSDRHVRGIIAEKPHVEQTAAANDNVPILKRRAQ